MVQSPINFFGRVDDKLEQCVIRVQGTGRGKTRTYSFQDAGPQIPLDVSFDCEAALTTLDADQRMVDLSRPPQGWFRMPEQRQKLVQRLTHQRHASATID